MNSALLTRIVTLILGLLYLASSVTKAMDINAFADTIVQYGVPQLRMFAPLIIGVEIALGFYLLFSVYRPRTGLFSLGLLILLTLIFAFGYFFRGITDCGCFGDVVSIPPGVSLLRNIFMIVMSYYIWKQPENKVARTTVKTVVAVILGVMTFAITGFEMKETYVEITVHEGTDLAKTFLKPFVNKEKDQLIFVFSPNCPHCQRETPRVNSYKDLDVIGLYPSSVSADALRQYRRKTLPNFRLFAVDINSIRSVTRTLPTALLVHKGSVRKIYTSEIPTGPTLITEHTTFPRDEYFVFSHYGISINLNKSTTAWLPYIYESLFR